MTFSGPSPPTMTLYGINETVGSAPGSTAPLNHRDEWEVTDSVRQAKVMIDRLPRAMAGNLTRADASGEVTTVFLAPGQPPEYSTSPVGPRLALAEHGSWSTVAGVAGVNRQAAPVSLAQVAISWDLVGSVIPWMR